MEKNHHAQCMIPDFFLGGKNLIEEIPCPRFICDGMPSTFHICGGHNMVHFQMTFNQVLFKTGMWRTTTWQNSCGHFGAVKYRSSRVKACWPQNTIHGTLHFIWVHTKSCVLGTLSIISNWVMTMKISIICVAMIFGSKNRIHTISWLSAPDKFFVHLVKCMAEIKPVWHINCTNFSKIRFILSKCCSAYEFRCPRSILLSMSPVQGHVCPTQH